MGASGLAGDVFVNDLVRSCDVSIIRSAEDGIYIAKLESNQAMVSAILSVIVALIHTL